MTYLTDKIYIDSKPDAFQPFYDPNMTYEQRQSLALQLTNKGYIVDWLIDIYRMDAGRANAYRLQLGVKYAPHAFQNMPDDTDWSKPFPGAIKVSVDAADFPPAHPAAPPPQSTTELVGQQSPTPGVYTVTPACFHFGTPIFAEGDSRTAPDGNTVYWHQYLAAPWGFAAWDWETAAARARREVEERTAIDNTGQRTGGAVQVNIPA